MSREHPHPPVLEGLPIGGGLPSHLAHQGPLPGVLDVVSVISNPFRYRSRFDLYRAWERRALDAGVRLTTVECAFGERPFEVTRPGVGFDSTEGRLQYVQLRSGSVLWLKESLINIGIARLPADWKYVCWLDADIMFARPDWAQEILHLLQHHEVVQCFSHWMNLKADYSPLGPPRKSFMAAYTDGDPLPPSGSYYGSGTAAGAHPGFAWAARRDAINALGGLLDVAILGSGDRHMAYALLGRVEESMPAGLSRGYTDAVAAWQERASRLQRSVGVVRGTILHAWHGSLASRKYRDRWRILLDCRYDPSLDLIRDHQLLYQLTGRSIKLRDLIANYFSARAEDALT